MKKILAVLICLVMATAMTMTAFAATITIVPGNSQGTLDEIKYDAYKVFDATHIGSGENMKISYTIDSNNPFFTVVQGAKDSTDKAYFTLDQIQGTTKYNVTPNPEYNDGAAATALANILKNFVDNATQKPTSIKSTWSEGKASLDIGEAEGYYLIISEFGKALVLDTLTSGKVITEKNEYPSLVKNVLQYNKTKTDTDGWVQSTSAERGEDVDFKITVTIPDTIKAGSTIVVHDELPEDMTFTAMEANANVTVKSPAEHTENTACDVEFTITVADGTNRVEVIEYTAKLSATADPDTAHTNTAYLTYLEYTGPDDDATVYTFDIPIFKFYKEGNTETSLAGVKFKLYKSENEYYINTSGVVTWGTKESATEYETDQNGVISFAGLEQGTYYIEETYTPDGFNGLLNDVTVTIDGEGKVTVTGGATYPAKATNGNEDHLKIENKTGTVLPSTGGEGTALLIAIGSITVLAATVVLVAKKRTAGYRA